MSPEITDTSEKEQKHHWCRFARCPQNQRSFRLLSRQLVRGTVESLLRKPGWRPTESASGGKETKGWFGHKWFKFGGWIDDFRRAGSHFINAFRDNHMYQYQAITTFLEQFACRDSWLLSITKGQFINLVAVWWVPPCNEPFGVPVEKTSLTYQGDDPIYVVINSSNL